MHAVSLSRYRKVVLANVHQNSKSNTTGVGVLSLTILVPLLVESHRFGNRLKCHAFVSFQGFQEENGSAWREQEQFLHQVENLLTNTVAGFVSPCRLKIFSVVNKRDTMFHLFPTFIVFTCEMNKHASMIRL